MVFSYYVQQFELSVTFNQVETLRKVTIFEPTRGKQANFTFKLQYCGFLYNFGGNLRFRILKTRSTKVETFPVLHQLLT